MYQKCNSTTIHQFNNTNTRNTCTCTSGITKQQQKIKIQQYKYSIRPSMITALKMLCAHYYMLIEDDMCIYSMDNRNINIYTHV